MQKLIENYKGLLLFMFVYWVVCFVMLFKESNFLYFMLPWNTFLALLPLVFIMKAEMAIRQRKVGWPAFWIILWLLFFPNSVYVITDFIHITNDKFLWLVEVEPFSSDARVAYSHEIMVWAKLFVIGAGFLFALLAGLESVYKLERLSRKKYSTIICFSGLAMLSLLTGLGVYIGRFLRFNSWDILANPIQLVRQVLGIDAFAVQFIAVFACFVFGGYVLYRTLRKSAD
ncbi:DUF1361 domain-containing protein [Sporosarcina sp. Sa2YVA2]|uniref:DUF1361 domain-containing protein n=1 Tax=Sporosarcina quadrami TaxID=2762234 RepID=A0ABR8U6L1_9BACL|nr:DUF1361 domain-containing protein [Sporosarcina quadrami]MBD7983666.1 DUF1361 domain-containing protein [Sporosarcina quadrami]